MLAADVQYFIQTARSGGIGRAAELLGISQPALSKAIARLEHQTGTALLRRTSKGVDLTEAGQAFFERACVAAINLEDALQSARDIGDGHAGLLRLGMTPATSHFVLGAIFPRLRQERPASVLKLSTQFTDELFEALLSQKLSLAVGPMPPQMPEGLSGELLYEESFSLVHNRDHPLAKRRKLAMVDLQGCDVAAPGVHEVARQSVEKALRDHGLRPLKVVVEANSLDALLSAVSTCEVISLIPTSTPRDRLPGNLVVRALPSPMLERRIGLFRGPGFVSSIGERAAQLLKLHAQGMTPHGQVPRPVAPSSRR